MSPSAVYHTSHPALEGDELRLQHEVADLAEHLKKGVAVTNVGVDKPVKRRTTFSIAPEHMREAQRSFRQSVTVVTDKKSFLGDLQADSQVRRDSAIDLEDDDKVLTPPPARADDDYTPHEINAKDYMDKVFRGKIKFPAVKRPKLPYMELDKKLVAEKAAKMPEDSVLVVKSNMDQAASLVLPQEIKTYVYPRQSPALASILTSTPSVSLIANMNTPRCQG